MHRLKALEAQMLASADQQVSLTDPDSQSMATSGRGSGAVAIGEQAVRHSDRLFMHVQPNKDGSL